MLLSGVLCFAGCCSIKHSVNMQQHILHVTGCAAGMWRRALPCAEPCPLTALPFLCCCPALPCPAHVLQALPCPAPPCPVRWPGDIWFYCDRCVYSPEASQGREAEEDVCDPPPAQPAMFQLLSGPDGVRQAAAFTCSLTLNGLSQCMIERHGMGLNRVALLSGSCIGM